jgi:hypothetical protein
LLSTLSIFVSGLATSFAIINLVCNYLYRKRETEVPLY